VPATTATIQVLRQRRVTGLVRRGKLHPLKGTSMSKKSEKYKSKSSMMKHEKSEGKKERKMEYGKKPKKKK
jgi:hypothetical protein